MPMSSSTAESVSFKYLSSFDTVTTLEKNRMANFLVEHLDDYTAPFDDVLRALDYALSKYPHQGGFVILAEEKGKVVGLAVNNYTHMTGYMPENVLVYVAVAQPLRGRGVGTALISKTLEMAKGETALHVVPESPIRRFCERAGFRSTYLEMRYRRG